MIIKLDPMSIDLEEEFLDELVEDLKDTVMGAIRGEVRRAVTEAMVPVRDSMRARLSERFNLLLQKGLEAVDEMSDDELIEAAWDKAI